jgi:predicted nucleic acid-binding protein
MIVLDTDVLSALMRRRPAPVAAAWVDEQPSESVWTTAISVFEIRFGLALLPPGRRRRQLEEAFAGALADDLEGRVIPFDHDAAREAAARAAERRAAGKPVDFRDIEIAGVVAARRATLATRNVRHFQGLGIPLVDPWARQQRLPLPRL